MRGWGLIILTLVAGVMATFGWPWSLASSAMLGWLLGLAL